MPLYETDYIEYKYRYLLTRQVLTKENPQVYTYPVGFQRALRSQGPEGIERKDRNQDPSSFPCKWPFSNQ